MIFYLKKNRHMAIKDKLAAISSLWNLLFENEQKCYAIKIHGIYYNILSLTDRTMEVKWGISPYKGDVTISNLIRCRNKTYKVMAIGESAFEECNGVTSATILDGVSRIGNRAFCNCSNLNYVNMPQSTTSIGKAAFLNCKELKDICIPEGIMSIGSQAFNGCGNLSHLYLRNTIPPVCESDAFDPISYFVCTLHVPSGALPRYRKDSVWSRFLTIKEKNAFFFDEKNKEHLRL
ncbi:MAG: cell surface protein [Bacteroidetes bacterium]|nr:cell surface protein [Bacteroidota bacterium]